MKITVSNKRDFTEWGGLIPIVNELYRLGIPDLVDSAFETDKPRVEQCKYKFSDVFTSLIASTLCGGVRIDNITGLKKELELIPGLNIPSHDTMGRLMKEMASKVIKIDMDSNSESNTNYYDDNERLNKLLIQISKLMGCFDDEDGYILDVDCTFISTKCAGAMTPKKVEKYGFFPMVCLIGDCPIFVSNRNGNSSDDLRVTETVEMCIGLLEKEGIKIKTVRTDGLGYNIGLTHMLHGRGIQFVSTSPVNKSFKKMWHKFESVAWRNTIIETANSFKECQVCEIPYKMTGSKIEFRVIGARIPFESNTINEDDTEEIIEQKLFRLKMSEKMLELKNNDVLKAPNKRYKDTFWKENKEFRYKLYITNDFDSSVEDIILKFNLRGDAERKFSFMKQDFGWKWPPFQNMNENTVFFILTAIANNVYRGFHKKYYKHIPELELNVRVNIFRKNFIKVLCYFIDENTIEYRGTNIDFSKIC